MSSREAVWVLFLFLFPWLRRRLRRREHDFVCVERRTGHVDIVGVGGRRRCIAVLPGGVGVGPDGAQDDIGS